MSRDELEKWYTAHYPDDPDVYNDHWLHTGYNLGLADWIEDVYEAMQDIHIRCRLSSAAAYQLRRFARAYAYGVETRPGVRSSTSIVSVGATQPRDP